MTVYKGLRRFDRIGRWVPGDLMPDTNPACRTAFRSISESVRHPSGTLSGITPECCPPSVRNPVRHTLSCAAAHDTRNAKLSVMRSEFSCMSG
jgi:hypothetical protein